MPRRRVHGDLTSERRSIKLTSASGSNSVVECDLAKVEVASSNLVSRSKLNDEGGRRKDEKFLTSSFCLPPSSFLYRRRSQVVRQRSAKPLLSSAYRPQTST